MVDAQRLLIFLDVVECGSLTAAGLKRGLSKAAVSKQITLLEKECGLQLLARTTRSSKLTEAGEELYEEVQRLKDCFSSLEALIGGLKKTPQGRLKIFSGRHFAESSILPHLSEWVTLYPLVTIDLELGEKIPDLEKEGIDILIGMSLSGPPQCIQKKIATTRYVLCASPDYLDEPPSKMDDLRRYRYLTHSMRRPQGLIKLGEKEPMLEPALLVNDTQALRQLALKGMGMIWVHEYVVHHDLERGQLVEILPELSRKADIPIYVCYLETKHVSTNVRTFIDFIVKHLQ